MQQRWIGSRGFPVGAVGLGCMPFTWAYGDYETRDEEDLVALVRTAVDRGVTLVDTADVYGPFTNELLVGRALAGLRDRVVLATKVGLVSQGGTATVRNARPDHIRRGCDASLRRLQTDRIDLYQLHRVDPEVPIEDSWGAMSDLVRAGKVRALGLSEVTVEEAQRAQAVFPVTSVQSELSLWTRDAIASGVLRWCRTHGVGFLAFSPLGRGFLTGTLRPGQFGEQDFRSRNPRFTDAAMRANGRIVEGVRRIAERRHTTPARVALAWVLAQGEFVVPIPGTTRVAHLEDNIGAPDLALTDDDIDELDELPVPVGARY